MTVDRKTAGQRAYETELQARPNYDNGRTRAAWEQLDAIAQWSWQRNPTPRWQLPESMLESSR